MDVLPFLGDPNASVAFSTSPTLILGMLCKYVFPKVFVGASCVLLTMMYFGFKLSFERKDRSS